MGFWFSSWKDTKQYCNTTKLNCTQCAGHWPTQLNDNQTLWHDRIVWHLFGDNQNHNLTRLRHHMNNFDPGTTFSFPNLSVFLMTEVYFFLNIISTVLFGYMILFHLYLCIIELFRSFICNFYKCTVSWKYLPNVTFCKILSVPVGGTQVLKCLICVICAL